MALALPPHQAETIYFESKAVTYRADDMQLFASEFFSTTLFEGSGPSFSNEQGSSN